MQLNHIIYVVKANPTGEKIWGKRFGGAKNDYAESVYATKDGGYIIVGTSYSFEINPMETYIY